MSSWRLPKPRFRTMAAVAVLAGSVGFASLTTSAREGRASAQTPPVTATLKWSRTFTCPGDTSSNDPGFNHCGFRESSPIPVNLDGQPGVAIGSLDGHVYALHLSDGSDIPGWPANLGMPINATPSAADVDASGQQELFITSGLGASPIQPGGYWSFDHAGHLRWYHPANDPNNPNAAVQASMAIGDINGDGIPDVTAGDLWLQSYSYTQSGVLNQGWPYYDGDSTRSTPALADVNGDGIPEVIQGQDYSGGPIYYYPPGGVVKAIQGNGHMLWYFSTNAIVRSSPAVGDVTGDGQPDIVFGTGDAGACPPAPQVCDTNKVFVLSLNGTEEASYNLGGQTPGSVALADVNGDGRLDIVEGTWGATGGQVWVIDGKSGQPLPGFPANPGFGPILGGITTADLLGDGKQDLLVPTGGGVIALSGSNGSQLFGVDIGQYSFQNSPLIVDNGDGTLGLIVAGQDPHTGVGVIQDYTIRSNSGTPSLGGLGWPMFHHDPRLTGSWTNPPLAYNPCPPVTNLGYRMVASDGGIFSYCVPFYGSTGGMRLNQPIVGMAPTPTGHGYWLVASDGGIFSFGDAKFYGSTGSIHLNQPIVGMAATPTGHGYWLVASDGGIFSFGDAKFYGSTGSIHLNRPIVGMAPATSGDGYWLVASDGGIFSFGDAPFYGSTGSLHLNQPIVGMAATPTGQGYRLVAADGGIFSFGDAKFYGSTGSIHLNQPIVGMASTPTGQGYRLVAADGGIFSFGDAPFYGSTGSIHLNRPIVGIANSS
jgi:hypothetical protein